MKIKLDKYKVFCKKRQREFEILVFEPPKHMWAYDCFPERDILAIDGDKDAYKLLKYAYAILAQDPSKIIYFAIANQGIGDYYASKYNLVLVRPELQFRYSDWYQIKQVCGAAAFLYPEGLKQVADRVKSDFYILPSSIHETIIFPAEETVDTEWLTKMVREVNDTMVVEEEILGDNVYFYSRESGELKMVA